MENMENYNKLTIIIPAKNEENTIEAVALSFQAHLPGVRLIVVDNNSNDNTFNKIKKISGVYPAQELLPGKGSAMKKGLELVQTEYVAFHDADLEYNPEDCKFLFKTLLQNPTSMVVGNRHFSKKSSSWFANKLIQVLLFLRWRHRAIMNVDILSGTRMASTATFKKLTLRTPDFRIETEINKQCLIQKVPILTKNIEYSPRGYNEGKKIRPSDIWGLIHCAITR